MIESISFRKYKKLNNITISFKPGLNAISGENGTCKSSLLYLISNSFQAVSKNCDWVQIPKCLSIINSVNDITNPKSETLQRGDMQYNDPAHGISGPLYSVEYSNHSPLEFRRHNSRVGNGNRYALKPLYKKGTHDALPFCEVIYLGLSRLVPFGEFQNESAISYIKQSLPVEYLSGIAKNYKKFTRMDITENSMIHLENIKTRSEFSSTIDGVDSNTISAGEDNLYIILLALESLRYYYDSVNHTNDSSSILLIDELDATLHPDYQIKLINLMRDYSQKYNIQIVFTTHSISAIRHVIRMKDNLIYLADNESNVILIDNPTIQLIEARLYNKTKNDIYQDRCIPILTEDEESRFFLEKLLCRLCDMYPEFASAKRFFSIPQISISGDTLSSLFKDEKLIRSHVGIFAILDGDKNSNLSNCIITLPGKNAFENTSGLSPEKLLCNYGKHLIDIDSNFWTDPTIVHDGISKRVFSECIIDKIEEFNSTQTNCKERDFYKKLFNENHFIFDRLLTYWLHDTDNKPAISTFYNNLHIMFNKCCELRGISSSEWNRVSE